MRTLQEFCQELRQQIEAMRRLLDRLLPVISESPHDVRQVNLQRMDELRGDFKHRQPGKRPLPGRFRYFEDEPVPFSESHYHKMRARLYREKADLRRGRRNHDHDHQ